MDVISSPLHTGYWEADLAGNPRFPDAVKFVIATVPELFGTAEGAKVQQWCQKWKWPLIWSFGTNPSGSTYHPPSWRAKSRVLDPTVLIESTASANMSSAMLQQAVHNFETTWQTATQKRAAHGATTADFNTWWTALEDGMGKPLQVEPIFAAACADPDMCIGVNAEGKCVCY
jgi:hypothetical protein